MTSDPKAPGAAAVYLYREETEDDPHAFRNDLCAHQGSDRRRERAPLSFTSVIRKHSSSMRWAPIQAGWRRELQREPASWMPAEPSNTPGEDQPWDTDTYVGKVEIGALEGRVIHPDGTVVPLTGKPSELAEG